MPNIKLGSIPPSPKKSENKINKGCKSHYNNDNPNFFLAMKLQGFVLVNANTLQRILLYKVSVNFIDLIFVSVF